MWRPGLLIATLPNLEERTKGPGENRSGFGSRGNLRESTHAAATVVSMVSGIAGMDGRGSVFCQPDVFVIQVFRRPSPYRNYPQAQSRGLVLVGTADARNYLAGTPVSVR